MGQQDKAETATGIDRGTRKQIVKWNQITALRFQTITDYKMG